MKKIIEHNKFGLNDWGFCLKFLFYFLFSDGTLWFIWLLRKDPRISQIVFIVLPSGFLETEEGKKNTDNREKQVRNTCDIELNIT